MTDFAFLQLVLAKSQSVEQAAGRYGCSLRTIRSWCQLAPISVRIAGGSHRLSIPLSDVFAVGGRTGCAALWNFYFDGIATPVIELAFDEHGVSKALRHYAKKKGGNRGNPGNRDVETAAVC
jgi:hypothetical protein